MRIVDILCQKSPIFAIKRALYFNQRYQIQGSFESARALHRIDDADIFSIKKSLCCCSVLQCVAVCCSVLQCVAECCSVSLSKDPYIVY